ncbi:hypothetical protein DFH06DRAFT_1121023 [Mycena polygramma]|nr:hypothetical protein DFH06DRAFT_1121023 [Mycena polygramma]
MKVIREDVEPQGSTTSENVEASGSCDVELANLNVTHESVRFEERTIAKSNSASRRQGLSTHMAFSGRNTSFGQTKITRCLLARTREDLRRRFLFAGMNGKGKERTLNAKRRGRIMTEDAQREVRGFMAWLWGNSGEGAEMNISHNCRAPSRWRSLRALARSESMRKEEWAFPHDIVGAERRRKQLGSDHASSIDGADIVRGERRINPFQQGANLGKAEKRQTIERESRILDCRGQSM